MKKRNIIPLSSALALAAVIAYVILRSRKKKLPELQIAPYVDLNRYLGKWYDIAHLPASFQKGCFNTQANYSLEKNGTIKVINTCNKGSVFGKEDVAEGTAKVVDKDTNAKLKVEFFWPFKGDYWILEVGENYDYALVGSPCRNYLWILSRTPHLKEAIFNRLIGYANEKGFSTNNLVLTKHQLSAHEF
jgi:apolipoprotein D and lipocalin family protein